MRQRMIQGNSDAQCVHCHSRAFPALIYAVNVFKKPVITTELIVEHGRQALNKNPNIFRDANLRVLRIIRRPSI